VVSALAEDVRAVGDGEEDAWGMDLRSSASGEREAPGAQHIRRDVVDGGSGNGLGACCGEQEAPADIRDHDESRR